MSRRKGRFVIGQASLPTPGATANAAPGNPPGNPNAGGAPAGDEEAAGADNAANAQPNPDRPDGPRERGARADFKAILASQDEASAPPPAAVTPNAEGSSRRAALPATPETPVAERKRNQAPLATGGLSKSFDAQTLAAGAPASPGATSLAPSNNSDEGKSTKGAPTVAIAKPLQAPSASTADAIKPGANQPPASQFPLNANGLENAIESGPPSAASSATTGLDAPTDLEEALRTSAQAGRNASPASTDARISAFPALPPPSQKAGAETRLQTPAPGDVSSRQISDTEIARVEATGGKPSPSSPTPTSATVPETIGAPARATLPSESPRMRFEGERAKVDDDSLPKAVGPRPSRLGPISVETASLASAKISGAPSQQAPLPIITAVENTFGQDLKAIDTPIAPGRMDITPSAMGREPVSMFAQPLVNGKAPTPATQVATRIAAEASSSTSSRIEVQLDPPELGRLAITYSISDDRLVAVLSAERSDTADLMRRHAELLSKELNRLGFDDVALSFAESEGGGRDEETEKDDNSTTHISTQEAGELNAAGTVVKGDGRLDIRL